MEETLSSANTSTKRQWIAAQARDDPERVFNSLHHFIDMDWMREAYSRTRKDGAPGVDGVTAADYETDLEANLASLLDRMKSSRYYAPPVRRTYIPKADGGQRPLGIPAFEDKVAKCCAQHFIKDYAGSSEPSLIFLNEAASPWAGFSRYVQSVVAWKRWRTFSGPVVSLKRAGFEAFW